MTKNADLLGKACGVPVAMAGRPSFSGTAEHAYLCDAGCRPNPGSHLPVVWDGSKFLITDPVEGTNHRASYHALHVALKNAEKHQMAYIELRITSELIYRQITTGQYCRNADLKQLRNLTFALADRVSPIRLVLVKDPFVLDGKAFTTRVRLRNHVLAITQKRGELG